MMGSVIPTDREGKMYNLAPIIVFELVMKDFEDRIEGIQGVLDAEIIGGLEREIHVDVAMPTP